jgi:hypothetical protein
MRLVKIMERGGSDLREYKRALKKAKDAIDLICDLTDDMEDKYSERDDDWDYEEDEPVRKLKHRSMR